MDHERKRVIRSFFIPVIFILVLWLVKAFEVLTNINLGVYGLRPLHWSGLPGIFTFPLLHANYSHLFANTLPLVILGSLLFYFYQEIAWKVVLLTYFISGLWLWFFADSNSLHIGASGVVYGLASFLFTSGILRRDTRLMAITLLVAFLYGGIIWGLFPQFYPKEKISWEGHLTGLLAGVILAIYFRKEGPQKPKYLWEEDEDEEEDQPDYYTSDHTYPDDPADPTKDRRGPTIRYHNES